MPKQKILIVSASFYPENSPRSFRTTELVKEFCKQGHNVVLMTIYKPEFHDKLKEELGFKILDLGHQKFKEIKGGKSKITNLIFRVFRRLLLLLFEYPDIEYAFKVDSALKGIEGFDLMISIAVPHPVHWGVAWCRTDKNPIAKVWVADCGDPFMGAKLDTFKKLFYFKYIEKAFCKKTDFISVPISKAVNAYYSEFRNKIVVIPQGFNFDESRKFLKDYHKNEVPTFAYTGNFIPGKRDIRPILQFLISTERDFKFYIYTRSVDMVAPYQKKASKKIIVNEFIPRSELLPILSTMDFLVNIENSVSEQMPSKLIDYHLVGRPTLSLDSNHLKKDTIIEFLDGDFTNEFIHPDIGQYQIQEVCNKFLRLSEVQSRHVEQGESK